jgi:hypothetical protein
MHLQTGLSALLVGAIPCGCPGVPDEGAHQGRAYPDHPSFLVEQ